MRHSRFFYVIGLLVPLAGFGCTKTEMQVPAVPPSTIATPIAEHFAYPIGRGGRVTEAKDKDGWYDAQNFGENDHLGEDWNGNAGGNTDCGQPVYATADGTITYAQDAGPGWGNVVIIEHTLTDGKKLESVYGHMQDIKKTEGIVNKGEQIGTVGSANGQYLCHLHFELRTSDCPMWNRPGPGYSKERTGWIDPSDFIDSHR